MGERGREGERERGRGPERRAEQYRVDPRDRGHAHDRRHAHRCVSQLVVVLLWLIPSPPPSSPLPSPPALPLHAPRRPVSLTKPCRS